MCGLKRTLEVLDFDPSVHVALVYPELLRVGQSLVGHGDHSHKAFSTINFVLSILIEPQLMFINSTSTACYSSPVLFQYKLW